MGGDEELALRIAVAEGIVSDTEARAVAEEAARGGQGVLERLRVDGHISGPTLASLRALVDGRAREQTKEPTKEQSKEPTKEPTRERDPAALGDLPTRPAFALAGTLEAAAPDGRSSDHIDPEAFPVPGWDHYEPVRLLGQGGMGRVFLARDLRLGRNVAIKFVRGDDPEMARRIVVEARAQARVNDERVCKVYEVGEERGRVYIAMQHIDGRPLSELLDELTVEQKAIVMRGAALGVAEAHRVGLIHRDIKPSNIMIERGADGELRPYVMDFGLARDWADETTMTGTVLGTPQYMAPEQARGEVSRLDRRADVYSLGATLYALLTGRPPIVGMNPLEILTRVPTLEPTRPRAIDPDIPVDLEAIVMKCLEKDRGARYSSARALADDLGRFLAGEPVDARSAGLGYRLRKVLRRRARLVAGVAVALVLVMIALGVAVHERRQAARREALARRFTERVEQIEATAQRAALAPVDDHDLREDRARIRAAMDELAAEIRAAGALAEASGHYALGRGYLALEEDQRAADELAQAWDRGLHEPRVAYALVLARGRLYQRALREVARSDLSEEQRAHRRRELGRSLREALDYLRRSKGLGWLSSRKHAEIPPEYVEALIAFYDDRFDDALAELDKMDRARVAGRWFYEAPLLRGEILHARAELPAGQAAAADLERGRHALEKAADIGRSVPEVYRARGELELTALWMEIYVDGPVEAPFHRGVEAADRVLSLLPDDAGALALRARLQRGLAEHRDHHGEDVTELLKGAVADAKRAVELDPDRREGRLALASTYKQWGEVIANHSQDPSEQLGQALQVLDEIPESERDADFYLRLGIIHAVWANYQDDVRQDSSVRRHRAIEAYETAVRVSEKAAQIDGTLGLTWLNLCDNYTRRAAHGQDPDGDFERAERALAMGRKLVPTNFLIYLYGGDLYSQRAELDEERRMDSTSHRMQAIELYEQGAAASLRNPLFHNSLSIEHLRAAEDARDRQLDPLPALAEAEAAARRAVEVAPAQGYGYINLGAALLGRADYQQSTRRADPMPAAREAQDAFEQAIKLLPDRSSSWRRLADLHILVAKVQLDAGLDPRSRLELAGTAIDRAHLSETEREERRGRIRELLGKWQARPRALAARAIR
jgi:hypothetical protein